jgi:galactokinase
VRPVLAFAPGRVNLIGEHTDYNQGLALAFAITQGVTVTATGRAGDTIEALAADLGETDSFLAQDPPPATGWRAFVRGVVKELRTTGIPAPGALIKITGTVSRGAGLGSSAALELALALALTALSERPALPAIELAQLCSRVEQDWVGASTGLLDQLASLLGQPGHALRIDFRGPEVRPVPLDLGDWRLVTLDSGERHAHASSGYNRRREECAGAAALLGLDSLRDATPEAAAQLPPPLERRVQHVIADSARVDRAVDALGKHDLPALGVLLDEAHASLRDLYEVSTPAVEQAVARLKHAGAAGARVVGGGFGGHVLGLMPPGSTAPPGALEVRPGGGALLTPK